MTAPDRAESPTEGTAGLLAAHVSHIGWSGGLGTWNAECLAGDWHDHGTEGGFLAARRAFDAHLAAVLDAHIAERCAETLEKAAATFQMNTWADVVTPALRTKGIPALAVGQAVVDWLRDRAAAVRGER